MSNKARFNDLQKNKTAASTEEPSNMIFPSFSSRQEAMDYLLSYPQIAELFSQLPHSMQENLLDYYTGKTGLLITYDSVFRRLFRPDLYKDRLEQLLSAILEQDIRILKVASREGTQLVEHGSFVIMDVLVVLEDQSYANIEMQKVGYRFPLARTDCYSSDIIMRQYTNLKAKTGKNFDFNMMNKVYCIVLMETSPEDFHHENGYFLHRRFPVFDTGVYKNNPGLHEDLFVCLDIFRSSVHNITDNSSPKDAWLTFLSITDPSIISSLLEHFPGFGELYRELAAFMMNPEELIAMFSEELYIMDRNTERLMVTELQDKVADLQGENTTLKGENTTLKGEKSALQGKVIDLEGENTALQGEKSALQGKVTDLEGEKTTLQGEKSALQGRVTDLEGENTALQSEKTALQGENKILQQNLDIFKLSHQGMEAEQISDSLHVSLETVNAILNS